MWSELLTVMHEWNDVGVNVAHARGPVEHSLAQRLAQSPAPGPRRSPARSPPQLQGFKGSRVQGLWVQGVQGPMAMEKKKMRFGQFIRTVLEFTQCQCASKSSEMERDGGKITRFFQIYTGGTFFIRMTNHDFCRTVLLNERIG